MRGPLTVCEIDQAVEGIREHARFRDFEAAHGSEIELFAAALKAIADGHPHSSLIAKAALKAKLIDFPRSWCA